jgi:hypothetical protein
MSLATENADWVRIGEVARILGLSAEGARRIVPRLDLTVRQFPGGRRKFLRADAERIAANHTGTATAPATACPVCGSRAERTAKRKGRLAFRCGGCGLAFDILVKPSDLASTR